MGASKVECDREHGIQWKYAEKDLDNPDRIKGRLFSLCYHSCFRSLSNLSLRSVTCIWVTQFFVLSFTIISVRLSLQLRMFEYVFICGHCLAISLNSIVSRPLP